MFPCSSASFPCLMCRRERARRPCSSPSFRARNHCSLPSMEDVTSLSQWNEVCFAAFAPLHLFSFPPLLFSLVCMCASANRPCRSGIIRTWQKRTRDHQKTISGFILTDMDTRMVFCTKWQHNYWVTSVKLDGAYYACLEKLKAWGVNHNCCCFTCPNLNFLPPLLCMISFALCREQPMYITFSLPRFISVAIIWMMTLSGYGDDD
jgi:hypothetical protein